MEFVINRGFEKCLNLYPRPAWEEVEAGMESLNSLNKKNRQFIRYMYRGASEVKPDASDRILLSKVQMEHASIEKEIILFAVKNYIEIWDKELYKKEMDKDPEGVDGISDLSDEMAAKMDAAKERRQNPNPPTA